MQPVFVEASALHDHGEMLTLLLQDAQILEWIAVDDQEVRESAGLEAAELAHLAYDLGSNQRGSADNLDRLLHLGADEELARLLALQLSQEIGAVGDGHPGALADFERAQAAVDDKLVLGQHVRAHAVLGGALLHLVV